MAQTSICVFPVIRQWLDLQANNGKQLKHSERTELAFKQAGRTIVVALPKPFRPHVEVPAALLPGEVQLQARTWRDGRPSQWSEPVAFTLADKAVAPSVEGIRLKQGSWVNLWPWARSSNDLQGDSGG